MRGSLLGAVLSVIVTAASPSPAAPPARDVCSRFAPLPVTFQFGTGAAPVGAALAADGGVYVGTVEGYLHALRADGSYRWSYTFAGAVIGRPVVGEAGSVFVPTARRIYNLRADGTLLWVFQSPVRVAGDLARDAQGRVHFASSDGRLFALSGRGALVGHVPGKTPFSAEPVALAGGAVAAGRGNGQVVLSARGQVQRFAVGSSVSAVLGCPGARLCAVAGGSLHALGSPGASWRVPALTAAATDRFLAVLVSETEIELWTAAGGERLYRLALPDAASAGPALAANGTAFVPLRSGALLRVAPNGVVRGCSYVAASPLSTPLVDDQNARVVATASEGIVASVALE